MHENSLHRETDRDQLSTVYVAVQIKNAVPETLEFGARPKNMTVGPVTLLTLITGSRDRRKHSVQFGLEKVQPMDDFKLNELKSSIDRACFDPT